MFGSKKVHAKHGLTTLIARDTRVEGTIKYSGELDIEGVIAGDILSEGNGKSVVKILENGRVEGEVRAPDVIINGHVAGDVFANGQLYLADKAVVEGNVHYNTIEMEKGAQINGKLVHLEGNDSVSENASIVPTKLVSNDNSKVKSELKTPVKADLASANT